MYKRTSRTSSRTLRTNNRPAYRLFYHIILSTKHRHNCITPEMLSRLEMICAATLGKWHCHLVEFGGEADHVHLLINAHPVLDLPRLIDSLKSATARLIRKEYAEQLAQYHGELYFWNKGYAVTSVGGLAPLETLLAYIQDQEVPPEPDSGT